MPLRRSTAPAMFVIPGLWDMHVHAYFTNDTARFHSTSEVMFPLFIVNGVTGVRDLGSNLEATLVRARQCGGAPADRPAHARVRPDARWADDAICRGDQGRDRRGSAAPPCACSSSVAST